MEPTTATLAYPAVALHTERTITKPLPRCKPIPSVLHQTQWPSGFFELPVEPEVRWFNPSVTQWRGQRWLAVRRAFNHPAPLGVNSIEIFNLDGKTPFNRQPIRFIRQYAQEHFEDPRLVVLSDQLFLSACNFKIQNYHAHQILAQLVTGSHPQVAHVVYGLNGDSLDSNQGNEKNWTWFDHWGGWHFVYTPWPHSVVATDRGKVGLTYTTCDYECPWRWGLPRGGSPPVFHDGMYWSFFHSSVNGDVSKGEPRRRYYMGAYAFMGKPPYQIKLMTLDSPLLVGSEADGWNLPVVFPGGAILDNGVWFVCFGCNDLKSAWIEIPHDDLILRMSNLF